MGEKWREAGGGEKRRRAEGGGRADMALAEKRGGREEEVSGFMSVN